MVSTYAHRSLVELQATKETLLALVGTASADTAAMMCEHLDSIEAELARRAAATREAKSRRFRTCARMAATPVRVDRADNGFEAVVRGGVVLGWRRWKGHGTDGYEAFGNDRGNMVSLGFWQRSDEATDRVIRWADGQAVAAWQDAA